MAVIKANDAPLLVPLALTDIEAEARQAGFEQARREQREAFSEAMKLLDAAANELKAARELNQCEIAAEAVTLAVAIARRITKRQCAIDPQVLEVNVGEAMKLVVDRSDVRIAIHPSQREVLDNSLAQLRLEWPAARIEIVEDAKIAPGGCRVFNHAGQVDADIDVQLDRIVAELLPAEAS